MTAASPLCAQVHCRTGSLEINQQQVYHFHPVHCRTGSLEKKYAIAKTFVFGNQEGDLSYSFLTG
jgi:hypothetical protein